MEPSQQFYTFRTGIGQTVFMCRACLGDDLLTPTEWTVEEVNRESNDKADKTTQCCCGFQEGNKAEE